MYFGLELHVHTFSAGETHTHEHTQIVLWAHLHINRFIFWPKKRRKTSNANPFHGQTDTNTLHSLTSAPWRLSPNPTQPHTTPRNPTQPHATPRNPTTCLNPPQLLNPSHLTTTFTKSQRCVSIPQSIPSASGSPQKMILFLRKNYIN